MALMHCGGIRTAWSGKPIDSACRSSSTRRTPCMLMRSYPSVTVVSSAVTRCPCADCSACSAIALSFPPLQQNRTSPGICSSFMACGVLHADAELPPQSGEAKDILIFLIGEIRDAAVKTDAVSEIVRSGQIESRIAGIVHQTENRVIVAPAGEVTGHVPGHFFERRVQHDVSRVHWAAKQPASGNIIGIEIVGRRECARGIVRVICPRAEPVGETRLSGKICAPRPRQVGVEKRTGKGRKGSTGRHAGGRRRDVLKTDDVSEAAVEIIHGHTRAVRCQLLFASRVNGPALLGKQIGISWKAGIGAERLIKSRLDDALAVRGAKTRVTERALCYPQRVCDPRARHNARPKIGVVFGACARAQCQPRNRLPPRIEKAGLIVATHMQADVADETIFDFVFVTGGNAEPVNQVRGLPRETGAVVLIEGREERIDIQFAKVELGAAQLMMPVGAADELRACVPAEIVKANALREVWRLEDRRARSSRGADVVTQGEVHARAVGKTPSEVAGDRAIPEGGVRPLSGSFYVRRGSRIVETTQESGKFRAAAACREVSSFAESSEFW